jgi:hypothetical protein
VTDLPDPPAPREEPEPFTNPARAVRGALSASILAGLVLVALAGLLAVGFLWLEPAADDTAERPPSPVAEPEHRPLRSVAPSDEVVQTELEAQLNIFLTEGGEAANRRLDSYRQGVTSAGCKLGLGHGEGFGSKPDAKNRGVAYAAAARGALTKDGSTFGAGVAAAQMKAGTFDYFVIFVVCPPVGEGA